MGSAVQDADLRLIYFDIRGFAEPLRWMLTMKNVPFVDERMPLDAWASQRKRSSGGGGGGVGNLTTKPTDAKTKRKNSLNAATLLRFKKYVGQLPILYDGDDFVLTQTLTVMRYLARKLGFNGVTELEEAKADEVADLVYDLRLRAVDYEGSAFNSATPDVVRHTVFRDFANAPESKAKEKMRQDFITMYFPLYFSKFASILETSGGNYIAGENLTYGDLTLVNFIEVVETLLDPNCLAEFPTLRALKEKIFAIPEIDKWRKDQQADQEESGFPENG
ncbi:glutathione S-transferase [Folsomia candida]|uniref:Glutathione S-transferase 2 n=1 Tax=Folsomia candida TaxID=158441 RepID=A0A226DK88_FOLCA|nr:glutathione S-transferase [Folsomia candida]OXA45021.1 Glutathione S-transferase 2 [Folsomia candida]